MKIFVLFLLSTTLIFASTSQEVEAKICTVVDMNVSHTQRMEKRISEIEEELKEKSKERLKKAKIREEKIQKLDETLKEKEKEREESYDSKNHTTSKKIKELLNEKELARANS